MKILVLNKDGFEQSDLEFLGMLEESKEFEKLIEGIRGKYDLPAEGHPLKLTADGKFESSSFHKKVCDDIDSAEKWIRNPIMDVLHAFNLPLYWHNTIYSIILFNLAIPPIRLEEWYKPVEIRYQGSLDGLLRRATKNYDHTNETEPHLTIIVREKMSLSQLVKELRKPDNEVKRYLSYLDRTPVPEFKDLGTRREMYKLQNKGMIAREIADKLNGEDEKEKKVNFTPEEDHVRKYNSRYEDFINRLPSKYFDTYLAKYLS